MTADDKPDFDEEAYLEDKIKNLNAANNNDYRQLQQQTGMSMDIHPMRLAVLAEYLVKLGVMENVDLLKMELICQEKIEEGLKEAWNQVRNQAGAQLLVPQKPQGHSGLIIPKR